IAHAMRWRRRRYRWIEEGCTELRIPISRARKIFRSRRAEVLPLASCHARRTNADEVCCVVTRILGQASTRASHRSNETVIDIAANFVATEGKPSDLAVESSHPGITRGVTPLDSGT